MSRFTDAANDVADKVHDTGAGHITRVKGWLNEAKDYLLLEHSELDFLQATVSLSIISGKHNYPISSLPPAGATWKVSRIKTVRIPSEWDLPLRYLSDEEFDVYMPVPGDTPGTPDSWTVWAGELLLAPQPNAAFTATIKVFKDIPDFTDSVGTPPWPEHFDVAWKHYAQYLGHIFNDEDILANKSFSLFEKGLDQINANDQIKSVPQFEFRGRNYVHGRIYRGPGYPRTYPSPYGGP